jgi:hypothetical protein
MKAHKLEILVIDHDEIGDDEIKALIEDTGYIYPRVLSIKTVDIGEWDDNHPLNNKNTVISECEKLFK